MTSCRCCPFFSFLTFLLLLIIVSCLVVAMPAVGYAEVTLDGSLGPAKNLNGPNFVIDAGDGTLVNQTNLFHSFGTFNLSSNESASFTGPQSINTIIGRITGGSQSSIDGLLRSAVPGADLFLINPAGFLFGPHASLDVQGSFHASSADYLRLGENGIFFADPVPCSVLTVDPPTAFGFLGDHPAGISIQESSLEVPAGKTISLVGGNITIVGTEVAGTGVLAAPGGRINLASVSTPGEVVLNAPGMAPDLEVDSFTALGDINLALAAVDAGGNGGGTVVIRGGCLALDDSSIHASVKGPGGSGVPGGGIDVRIADKMQVNNGTHIGTNVLHGVPEDSAGVRITADRLEVTNNSEIGSDAFGIDGDNPASSGNCGDTVVNVNSLLLDNFGGIYTGTGGTGDGGDIFINTGMLEVRNNSYIYTLVFGGSGDGGNIAVDADHILLSNETYSGNSTGILAETSWPGTGRSGDVTVNSNTLRILPGAEISTTTYNVGQCGNLKVNVTGDAYIEGTRELNPDDNPIYTGIFANTFWSGDGSYLEVKADNLEMITQAGIQAMTFSTGDAGNCSIAVGNLEMKDGSLISTNGLFGSGGDAGNTEIIADSILLSGPESSPAPFTADFTGISTNNKNGDAGSLSIKSDNFIMTNRSQLDTSTYGSGKGGTLEVLVDNMELHNGAQIIANAFGTGDGGNIKIAADRLVISGVHPEVFTNVVGKRSLAGSAIGSQTGTAGGSAGDTILTVGSLELLDGGRLTVETFGPGDAGNIEVMADRVFISGINQDLLLFFNNNPKGTSAGMYSGTASVFLGDEATGHGGNIRVTANDIQLQKGGLISSSTDTPGNGGDIELTGKTVTLSSGSMVSSSSKVDKATITGNAGDISINAEDFFQSSDSSVTTLAEQSASGDISISSREMKLFNNSLVSAESSGEGDAGDIYLGAADSFTLQNSAVTTESRQADGGNIKVDSRYLVHLMDSEITSSVGGGVDTVGGNISIDPEYVVLDNSRIIANAYEGLGGNIDVIADVFLADPQSVLDASSALGVDGSVDIRAPITSVSGTIAPLPEDFRSVVALLRKPCMARIQQGKYSSFVVSGRDGLPRDPGTMLPSPLLSP